MTEYLAPFATFEYSKRHFYLMYFEYIRNHCNIIHLHNTKTTSAISHTNLITCISGGYVAGPYLWSAYVQTSADVVLAECLNVVSVCSAVCCGTIATTSEQYKGNPAPNDWRYGQIRHLPNIVAWCIMFFLSWMKWFLSGAADTQWCVILSPSSLLGKWSW